MAKKRKTEESTSPVSEDGRITAQGVVELWKSLEQENAALIALDQRREDIYFDRHTIEFPKAFRDKEEVHSGLAFAFISQVKGIMSTLPRVSVDPAGLSGEARRQSSAMEDALSVLLPALGSKDRTWERVKEDALRLGRGVSKLLYLPQGWQLPELAEGAGEDAAKAYTETVISIKQAKGVPMRWQHVPARNVFRDGDAVVEKRQKRVRDLLKVYDLPKLRALLQTDQGRVVIKLADWYEYWDGERVMYIVAIPGAEPEIAMESEHKYGRPPYLFVEGEVSSSDEPHLRSRSLLDAVLLLIERVDRTLSQQATGVRRWAWSPPLYKRQWHPTEGEGAEPGTLELDLTGDKVVEIWGDEDLGWLPPPPEPSGLREYLGLLLRFVDRLTVPSVVAGSTPSDVTAGYAINSLIQAATQRFVDIRHALEEGYAELCRRALDIIEHQIGTEVYIYRRAEDGGQYLKLAPSQINGWRNLSVSQEIKLPFDENAAVQRAIQLKQSALEDDNTIREKHLGNEHPERIEDALLIQEFNNSPEVKQARIAEALKRSGNKLRAKDEAATPAFTPENVPPALAEALAAMGGGMPQPAGGPGEMGEMPPGAQARIATQSVTRAPGQSRAPGGVAAGRRGMTPRGVV